MVGRAGVATPLSRVERDAQRARRPPRRVPTQRLDAEPRRQRVGQRPRQHPSGAQSMIATNLRVGRKSKCMRDRNLRMSGSRETRVSPGSIEVRSQLPAGGRRIRTVGPWPKGPPWAGCAKKSVERQLDAKDEARPTGRQRSQAMLPFTRARNLTSPQRRTVGSPAGRHLQSLAHEMIDLWSRASVSLQRVVPQYPLQPAQRQAARRHRHHHAAAA